MNKFDKIVNIASYLIASVIGGLLVFQVVYIIWNYIL